MAYWAEVARRAWRESARTVKLDSRKLLMVLVLGQIVVGIILYLALGPENLPANVFARSATIAAPLVLFIPFFVIEFILTPPKMHAEQLTSLKRAATQHEAALQAAATSPSTRDSTILNLQEENAALHEQVSELRYRTDADYPFDTVQRAALVFFLSNVPVEARFQVTIRYSGFAGNSDYPRRMARAFREAGWSAQITPDVGIQSTNEGVHLASHYTSNGELEPLSTDGEVLREALEKAGISFHLSGQRLPEGLKERPSFFFCVFPPSV